MAPKHTGKLAFISRKTARTNEHTQGAFKHAKRVSKRAMRHESRKLCRS